MYVSIYMYVCMHVCMCDEGERGKLRVRVKISMYNIYLLCVGGEG